MSNASLEMAFGWLIVSLGIIAAGSAIVLAVWFSICPGEHEPGHPKRLIFKDER